MILQTVFLLHADIYKFKLNFFICEKLFILSQLNNSVFTNMTFQVILGVGIDILYVSGGAIRV